MCVILRRTAAGKAKKATSQAAVIDRIARSIDEAAAGLIRGRRDDRPGTPFVAFQVSRDDLMHEALATAAPPRLTVSSSVP